MDTTNNENKQQLRTLELSTNVNDYDTGEPTIDGSIRKTLIYNSNQKAAANPLYYELYGVKVGSKYVCNTCENMALYLAQSNYYCPSSHIEEQQLVIIQ
jgi:hypothetical protein